jgi:hypothetical protein
MATDPAGEFVSTVGERGMPLWGWDNQVEVGQLGRLGAAAIGHGIVPYLSQSGRQTPAAETGVRPPPIGENRRC